MNSDIVAFQEPPKIFNLSHNEAHIWCVDMSKDYDLERLKQILNHDELATAKRYRFEKHQKQSILSRAILRELLAKYLQLKPQAIAFSTLKRGKLWVDSQQNPFNICFNVTHSDERILFSFMLDVIHGIDIEYMERDRAWLQLAKRYFATEEQSALNELAMEQYSLGFYHAWTRKEAFIKATGEGLHAQLDSFAVTLKPGEDARFLRIDNPDYNQLDWHLHAFYPDNDYCAALAVAGTIDNIYYYTTDGY